MAANVICITDPARWEIIRDFLCELGEGGIVLGPDAVAAFEQQHSQPPEETCIDYDFGGEADILVDWHNDKELDHFAIAAIEKHMGLADEDEDADSE